MTCDIFAIDGIRLSASAANIRKKGRYDLALIEVCEGASVACVMTRNRFKAAPIIVSERHINLATPRFLLINSGCANTGLGQRGIDDALLCCQSLAELVGVNAEQVLPFSTGVIGEVLPVNKIISTLKQLLAELGDEKWMDVAKAILTTDTYEKYDSRKVTVKGCEITFTGIAKGSGMIHPDMATMLGFIATDLAIDKNALHDLLHAGCDQSFNAISVDGDTSTNDSCVLCASGKAPLNWKDLNESERTQVREALFALMRSLAKQIARDGEGATRLIEIKVSGAKSAQEARIVGRTIATSPLVKTACYAKDPNWGRIIAALGRSPIDDIDMSKVRCSLDDYCIFENGAIRDGYQEEIASQKMSGETTVIQIDLARGNAQAEVWTSDLTEEYVKINTDYRS